MCYFSYWNSASHSDLQNCLDKYKKSITKTFKFRNLAWVLYATNMYPIIFCSILMNLNWLEAPSACGVYSAVGQVDNRQCLMLFSYWSFQIPSKEIFCESVVPLTFLQTYVKAAHFVESSHLCTSVNSFSWVWVSNLKTD